jgi:molybdate transport system substrate-binding protein
MEVVLKPSIKLALGFLAAAAIWGGGPAQSAEITVLLNQATATGVRELAAGFEKATGNKVKIDYLVGQALYQKIIAGGPGDLASLGSNQFDEFIKAGKIDGNSVVEYGRVGNGVAVRAGEPLPDIRTPDALKRALLEAKSIGHTKVGTGPFNTRLFQKLGIYDQIKDKIKIVEGKLVAQAVLDGDVDLGIQQTNVIQPLVGTVYLGPLPPELMEYGSVGIGLLKGSKEPQAATDFIKYMADPANAALLKKGFMYPPLK